MGYLDKSTITVDAILTNRGRELLSQGTGTGNFQITKFAVADDEVDYGLYNTAHPLGSNYYGAIIENMPVLEATPDETQIMRYKLVTVSGADASGVVVIPQITNIGFDNAVKSLSYSQTVTTTSNTEIEPKTTYTATSQGQVEADGYTLVIADSTLAKLELVNPSTGEVVSNTRGSVLGKGFKFKITAKNKTGTTTVTIYGNNSGAAYTFTLNTTASA
jgi:hypothetical protein